jgi:3'-phosphoadenosine 5'-phosphosulfate sulfotransferase (PAPS reductase)/FAD synthetase
MVQWSVDRLMSLLHTHDVDVCSAHQILETRVGCVVTTLPVPFIRTRLVCICT